MTMKLPAEQHEERLTAVEEELATQRGAIEQLAEGVRDLAAAIAALPRQRTPEDSFRDFEERRARRRALGLGGE